MKPWLVVFAAGLAALIGSAARAQTSAPAPQVVKGPDERLKADILVVVAHPDDEGGVTPYLARAIYDEHKRVALVYTTRGGSGGNDYSREHGPALADIREQEARQACAKLGITNVWFLDGKDTASQNVLNSLANWGHGANLEGLVRIVRLTRPEVIISWLPGIFIGENHGDHQASGVLATEAFDLANDPTAFPAQVAGASKRLEIYLENLTPWQPKKLYFFSDADDQKQFTGTGPTYSVKEISPSQKKPYWRLAMDAATPHLTQFPAEIHQLTSMNDEQLNKFMDDPQHQWWTEPMTLTLGKSWVKGETRAEVFQGIRPTLRRSASIECAEEFVNHVDPPPVARMTLSGPWGFYGSFRTKHCIRVPEPKMPEIAVKAGTSLLVPLSVEHTYGQVIEVSIEITAPPGWKITSGQGTFRLPEEDRTDMFVEISAPALSNDELKKSASQEVIVRGSAAGKSIGEVRLDVLLKGSALAQ
jgi:LmbE family N-acetylglucosaminyl deacetylase